MPRRHPFDVGPSVLVAHRCDDHRAMAPLNKEAIGLVFYAAETRPRMLPLGQGPNHEEITAECGGCLAEETEGLYQINLDLLDTIADLLTSRAELRKQLETRDSLLP